MDPLSVLLLLIFGIIPIMTTLWDYSKHRKKADNELIALQKETNRLLVELLAGRKQ